MNTTKQDTGVEASCEPRAHEARCARVAGSDLPFGTVFFEPRLRGPRSMMLTEGMVVTESLGHGGAYRPMTREQWLDWLERFRDELTGREFRECREAALRDFQEPQEWTDYRRRYAETGTPWLN